LGFFGLSLHSYNSQFPCRSECTRQYILARRRQANMRVSHLSPSARNRQENLGRLLHKRRLLLQRKHQISVPPACEATEANFLPPTRKAGNPAWEYSSTLQARSILRKSAAVIG